MRIKTILVAIIFVLLPIAPSALAGVLARIDLSQQRMRVYVNGYLRYSWPVSTARRGYRTPVGRFRPRSLHRMHYSRIYHNSPMPHSIFFYGGFAIHGTYATRYLGRRASHGCIRLHPGHARTLFNLVRRYGRGGTRIVVTW